MSSIEKDEYKTLTLFLEILRRKTENYFAKKQLFILRTLYFISMKLEIRKYIYYLMFFFLKNVTTSPEQVWTANSMNLLNYTITDNFMT